MKIAILCSAKNIIPPVKTGGTEQPTYYLAKELAKKGHKVTLYAARGSRVPGVKVKEIAPLALGLERKNLLAQDQLASYFNLTFLSDFFKKEANNFDVIQFNNHVFYEILPFVSQSKIPVIIRINYPYNYLHPYIKNGLKKFKNVYYLPISNFIKEMMPDLPYLETIYPAVNFEDFAYNDKPKDYLLFIGRICHNKGTHLAIKAAKRANKKLIIAGRIDYDEPYIKYFNEQIKPYINNKKVEYVGEVDFETKVKLYQGALATLFPVQWDEPFGNVQIESMACGTPIIAFKRAACEEAIRNKTSGLLVEDGNVSEMVKAIKEAGALKRNLVRKWAENNFSIVKIVRQYEKVYNTVIKLQ